MRESLRAIRLAAGMTQEEAASRIGIARNTYSQIETGIRTPRLPLAHRMAAVFGASIETLFPASQAATDRPASGE